MLLYTTLGEMSILKAIKCYDFFEVKDMKPLKKKVSITLDEDLILKVKLIAEQDDRSFSQYINLVLREYLEKQAADE